MARDRVVRFAIGVIGIIGINEKEKAVPPGEKRKRKQIMPVLITIAALFAVQIYAPAFAGAWPRASDSGYVALKRGSGAGNAGAYVTHQAGEPNSGGDLQSAENSQTLEAYGEYAISQNILIIAKHHFQNTHLENDTRRTIYHELGVQTPVPFLAIGLLPPGSLRALRFAFPTIKFSRDRAAAMQIFHHHTHIKTLDDAGPAATHQDGGGLTITIADRLSWQRYHLTQNLAVTQFNGRSSGVWKNDYEIHLGYDHQISLGWISEIYENRAKSYTSRNSYVAVSFSPPDHRFNLRVLRGQNAVAGRPNTFRSYRLEVGWSFP